MMKTFMLDFLRPGYWRTDPAQMGGDFFADTGSHLVDLMLWLGGAPPVEVLAYSPRNRPQQTSILTLEALLSNDVILSINFNDHIAMGDEFNYAGSAQMVVLGDRGRLTTSLGWGTGPAENLMIEPNGARSRSRSKAKRYHQRLPLFPPYSTARQISLPWRMRPG